MTKCDKKWAATAALITAFMLWTGTALATPMIIINTTSGASTPVTTTSPGFLTLDGAGSGSVTLQNLLGMSINSYKFDFSHAITEIPLVSGDLFTSGGHIMFPNPGQEIKVSTNISNTTTFSLQFYSVPNNEFEV